MRTNQKALPPMGDDDWLMVAHALEELADLIRETVDAERAGDTTRALREIVRGSGEARALVDAAAKYGRPQGWSQNADPIYST